MGGAHGSAASSKTSLGGVFQTRYGFCSVQNCAEGPALIEQISQGNDGNFYGTTSARGTMAHCFSRWRTSKSVTQPRSLACAPLGRSLVASNNVLASRSLGCSSLIKLLPKEVTTITESVSGL